MGTSSVGAAPTCNLLRPNAGAWARCSASGFSVGRAAVALAVLNVQSNQSNLQGGWSSWSRPHRFCGCGPRKGPLHLQAILNLSAAFHSRSAGRYQGHWQTPPVRDSLPPHSPPMTRHMPSHDSDSSHAPAEAAKKLELTSSGGGGLGESAARVFPASVVLGIAC